MNKREDIKSGDLLIWKKTSKSKLSNAYLSIIRFFTSSEFAHTGIAWVLENRVYVIEATQPLVRISPIKANDEFYLVPMNITWDKKSEEYLLDKVGLKYSLFDAIRAYLGMTLDNDRRYQCAELAAEFYLSHGIDLGKLLTPAAIVNEALIKLNIPLVYVSSESKET